VLDAHSQMILDEYKENQETYKIIQKIAMEHIHGFFTKEKPLVDVVESRIKAESSLAGKLELKGYKYKSISDITDIVGCRIVTFYNDDVDKYAAKIEQTFKIDWEHSIDKRKVYSVDQFGYKAVHYICSIPVEMYTDNEHPLVNELKFEVQIKSVLQHVWATVFHDTGYKNDVEVPKEYLRALNRLAGLLELADESFTNIRNSLADYKRKVKSVVSSGNFNGVELNGDTFEAYLNYGEFDRLTKRIANINRMEVIDDNPRPYLKVLKLMKFNTIDELDKALKEYTETAYQFAIRQFDEMELDIIASTAGIFFFCIVYLLSSGGGLMSVNLFLEELYGTRRSNASYAKRLFAIGTQMGIVKEIE